MKFTIVLPSHENTDLSIAAVYISCLVWKEGNRELLSPHSQQPLYQRGDLQQVLAVPQLRDRLAQDQRHAVVVCHPIGHGTENCLDGLLTDLKKLGYQPGVVRL